MYKIDKLIKSGENLFHTNDLALLWQTANRNTLYTTIKRYTDKGILIPVQKGLYSTILLKDIDPLKLGAIVLHTYSYVSCEHVLYQSGIISQVVYAYTFVSSVSKKFTISGNQYISRRLKDECLFRNAGISEVNKVFIATTERALADTLYFDPKFHFDSNVNINLELLTKIQKEVYGK